MEKPTTCIALGFANSYSLGSLWRTPGDEVIITIDNNSIILDSTRNLYIGERTMPDKKRMQAVISNDLAYALVEIYSD